GATEAGVAAHVEQWLRKERFEVEVHEVAPGRPNVFGMLGERESSPTLLLEGHTDVVTEGDTALWRRPPFGGDLVDGRIYGRDRARSHGPRRDARGRRQPDRCAGRPARRGAGPGAPAAPPLPPQPAPAPAHGDADDRAGPGAGRGAVERHPVDGPGHARRAAH